MKKRRTLWNLIGLSLRENILQSFATKTKMGKWIGYVIMIDMCDHKNIIINKKCPDNLESMHWCQFLSLFSSCADMLCVAIHAADTFPSFYFLKEKEITVK